jgi:hypothetical protein
MKCLTEPWTWTNSLDKKPMLWKMDMGFGTWKLKGLYSAWSLMDVREIGWGGMDWIDLAQDRDQWRALVNTVMNLRVP